MDGQGQMHTYEGTVIGWKRDSECWLQMQKFFNILKIGIGRLATVLQVCIWTSDDN